MRDIDATRLGPQNSAKRTGALGSLQSGRWLVLGLAWSALAIGHGGVDLGDGASRGVIASLVATVVLVVLATRDWLSRGRSVVSDGSSRLVIFGATGLALLSALSILWASAPDLAWIETNRAVAMLAALLVGMSFALSEANLRRPTEVLALAALPLLSWGLLTKVFPDLASDGAGARLREPLTSFNALALLAAMALPGALALAIRAGRSRWRRVAGAAGVVVVIVAVVLTYSRGGLVAMGLAVIVLLSLSPQRGSLLAALVAAAVGALPALVLALTMEGLNSDGVPLSDRRAAGVIFGLLMIAGVLVAALLRPLLEAPLSRRSDRWWSRMGTGLGVLVLAAFSALLASGRISDEGVGNGVSHLASGSFNNRFGWWAEALRGAGDAPVIGNGAGSFPLVHLLERGDQLEVRQPHQLILQIASDLGLIGLLLLLALGAGALAGVRRAGGRHGWVTVAPVAAALTAFFIGVQVDVAWSIPLLVLPAFGLLGLLLGAGRTPGGPRRLSPAATSIGLAVSMLAILSVTLPAVARHVVARGEDAALAGKLSSARSDARLAEALNPFDVRAPLLRARASRGLGDSAGRLAGALNAVGRQPKNPRAQACLQAVRPSASTSQAIARLNPMDPLQRHPRIVC